MLIILSPAKIQNFKKPTVYSNFTQPVYMSEAKKLVSLMRKLSPFELSKLLDINSKLTELNYDRYFNWHLPFALENAKQAALAFDGEVFRGLNADTFNDVDFEYAQEHLIILSGLYGALRPLDLIQPYRLEISSLLQNEKGRDLYAFWDNKITKHVLKAIQTTNSEFIINLASTEYSKIIDRTNKKIKMIDIEFLEYKNDQLKPIVIYIKKARGLMARYIIQNQLKSPDDLKGFADAGYWFSPQLSTENKFVFIR